jgi:heterodisulfide reductase subunit A-like polyferredoxin
VRSLSGRGDRVFNRKASGSKREVGAIIIATGYDLFPKDQLENMAMVKFQM